MSVSSDLNMYSVQKKKKTYSVYIVHTVRFFLPKVHSSQSDLDLCTARVFSAQKMIVCSSQLHAGPI